MTDFNLSKKYQQDFTLLSNTAQNNIIALLGNEPASVFSIPFYEMYQLFELSIDEKLMFHNYLSFNKNNDYYFMRNIANVNFIFITENYNLTFDVILQALINDYSVNKDAFIDSSCITNFFKTPSVNNYIREQLLKSTIEKEIDYSSKNRIKSKI